MDRADKFINNRHPKILLMILLLVLAAMGIVDWFLAIYAADRVAEEKLDSYLLGAGGSAMTDTVDDESLSAGEEIVGRYGIRRELPEKLVPGWRKCRNSLFVLLFAVSAVPAVMCFFAGVSVLYRTYDSIEELRSECVEAAEKLNFTVTLRGNGSECIRRLSESADLLVSRMNSLSGELQSERRYLRDFLGDFSHQIKTSLAVVRLNSDMIAETEELSDESREKLAEEIQLNLDGMEELVIQAIKAARLDTDTIEYDIKNESLVMTCKKAIRRIEPMLRSRNIAMRTDFPEDVIYPHDKGWLCEAVENIIKNSADHSGCDEIFTSVERDPIMTKLIISDNGKGIEQGDIPHLFDKFAHRSSDRSMKSAGMGMSIAQKIVRKNGGEIYVYSEPEKGTRFEIVFLN